MLLVARKTPPESMGREKWEFQVDYTGIGIANCFSDVDHITDDLGFARFSKDLLDRLQQPIDESEIDWIWDKMKVYSTIGSRGYVDRFRPTGDAFESGLMEYRDGTDKPKVETKAKSNGDTQH